MKTENNLKQDWMKKAMFFTGICHLIAGLSMLVYPSFYLPFIDNSPSSTILAGILGIFILTIGLAYILCSKNPIKNWIVSLIGITGNAAIALFCIISYLLGIIQLTHIAPLVLTCIVISIPFAFILWSAYQNHHINDEKLVQIFSQEDVYTLDMFDASNGMDLLEMSEKWPTMVVFLRHFGCTFCRESLSDLAKVRNKIEISGTKIVLVHMIDEDTATNVLTEYKLHDIPQVSDPEGILYKRFNLKRGGIRELFGLKVLLRGFKAGVIDKHGIGKEQGDIFQMPGIFILKNGQVLKKYLHARASDRPDYENLAC